MAGQERQTTLFKAQRPGACFVLRTNPFRQRRRPGCANAAVMGSKRCHHRLEGRALGFDIGLAAEAREKQGAALRACHC